MIYAVIMPPQKLAPVSLQCQGHGFDSQGITHTDKKRMHSNTLYRVWHINKCKCNAWRWVACACSMWHLCLSPEHVMVVFMWQRVCVFEDVLLWNTAITVSDFMSMPEHPRQLTVSRRARQPFQHAPSGESVRHVLCKSVCLYSMWHVCVCVCVMVKQHFVILQSTIPNQGCKSDNQINK